MNIVVSNLRMASTDKKTVGRSALDSSMEDTKGRMFCVIKPLES